MNKKREKKAVQTNKQTSIAPVYERKVKLKRDYDEKFKMKSICDDSAYRFEQKEDEKRFAVTEHRFSLVWITYLKLMRTGGGGKQKSTLGRIKHLRTLLSQLFLANKWFDNGERAPDMRKQTSQSCNRRQKNDFRKHSLIFSLPSRRNFSSECLRRQNAFHFSIFRLLRSELAAGAGGEKRSESKKQWTRFLISFSIPLRCTSFFATAESRWKTRCITNPRQRSS